MTFLETSLVILEEASLALQVETLSVEMKTKMWKKDNIAHIQGNNNKNSCLKQIDHVITLLTIILSAGFHILLYMKEDDTLKVGFL